MSDVSVQFEFCAALTSGEDVLGWGGGAIVHQSVSTAYVTEAGRGFGPSGRLGVVLSSL
jgi:hypothetical protein